MQEPSSRGYLTGRSRTVDSSGDVFLRHTMVEQLRPSECMLLIRRTVVWLSNSKFRSSIRLAILGSCGSTSPLIFPQVSDLGDLANQLHSPRILQSSDDLSLFDDKKIAKSVNGVHDLCADLRKSQREVTLVNAVLSLRPETDRGEDVKVYLARM